VLLVRQPYHRAIASTVQAPHPTGNASQGYWGLPVQERAAGVDDSERQHLPVSPRSQAMGQPPWPWPAVPAGSNDDLAAMVFLPRLTSSCVTTQRSGRLGWSRRWWHR